MRLLFPNGFRLAAGRKRNRRRPPRGFCHRADVEVLESRDLLSADPIISEFVAKNDGSLLDGYGRTSDWIEIHNAGDAAIDLADWHLTDDFEDLSKWTFPTGNAELTTIAAGGYLIVFASGIDVTAGGPTEVRLADSAGYLHTSFKIDAEGEYLALVGPGGVASEIGSEEMPFPQQYADVSYGHSSQDNGALRFFAQPTPAAANGAGFPGVVTSSVDYSEAGRTFTDRFSLALATASENGTIRYTIDGSVPNELSPVFTTPITISSTTQIRARVFESMLIPGPVQSQSFLHLEQDVASFTSPLPILVVENYGQGEFPNKRGHNPPAGDGGGIQQVERQSVQLDFFERSDSGVSSIVSAPDLAVRAGVRVRGSSSATFQKKSLTVEAWDEHDQDVEIEPFGMPAESDWILYAPSPEFDHALIHNSFAYELSRQIGRYAVRFQFVEVFMNTDGTSLSMDDHAGIYLFMEKVKRDPQRVDVEEMSPDGTDGGWLLQSNRMQPIAAGGVEHPPNFHTRGPNRIQEGPYGRTFTGGTDQGGDDIPTGYNTFFNFESPRAEEINASQIDAIVGWLDEFETALYGPDFADPEIGYRAYIDVPSFVDHMLLTNLTLSFDALQLSTYLFLRSPDDKLELGPVWDFDRAYGADSRAASPSGNLTYGRQFLWMPQLFKDANYVQQYQDRWQELREGPFSTENLHAIIDRQAAEITVGVAEANGTFDWPAKVLAMKEWLAQRAEAIDAIYLTKPTLEPRDRVSIGGSVDLLSTDGAAYYTTDGTDPRKANGEPADGAIWFAGGASSLTTLVTADSPATAIVPSLQFDNLYGTSWTHGESFDDSEAAGWQQGRFGIGFDERDTYVPLIGNNVIDQMLGINTETKLLCRQTF